MEFCDRSLNSTNFAPQFHQICALFAGNKKFSIGLESLHFRTFSAKCREYREIVMEFFFFKLWKSHRKKVCGNPALMQSP